MLHDVTSARYLDGYRVELEFDDGTRGVVDLGRFAGRGGVFARFSDLAYFRGFSVDPELGTLTWYGEVDIAPETLYAEATGRSLPDWMRPDEDRALTAA
jgi:hypothetical protein